LLTDRVAEINELCGYKCVDDVVNRKYAYAYIKSLRRHIKGVDVAAIRSYEIIFSRYFREEYERHRWVEPTYVYEKTLKFTSSYEEILYIEKLSNVLSVDISDIEDGIDYVTPEYTLTLHYVANREATTVYIRIVGKLNINITLLKSVHLYPPTGII